MVVLINTPAGASSALDNALSSKKKRQTVVEEKVIPFDFFFLLLRLKNIVHLEEFISLRSKNKRWLIEIE